MNDETQLLAILDRVLGFTNKLKSSYKKVQQFFDEQTNETVILLEYRVRTPGMTVAKNALADRQKKNLLRQINQQAQQIDSRKKKPGV